MTSFTATRRCFAKLNTNDVLFILSFVVFQLFARGSAAVPEVAFIGHQTDRFGPNSLPFQPVGDKVQIFAAINSTDPIGSTAISVQAVQGSTTLMLDPIPPDNPLFRDVHGYYKFIDFDPDLTGSWQIIPTDSTGIGPPGLTNTISDPEFLPLVEEISVQGTPFGVRVAWTLPNLAGFDPDGLAVRVIEAVSGRHMWQSAVLPYQTTRFDVPADVFQSGVNYVCWVNLGDAEGNYVENSSKAFSGSFRFTDLTVNGDFNLDGTVDAADYVVWRKELGTTYTQNDYNVWREHFGASLGTGSGSALPSAEPLSAAVPEPSIIAMLSTVLLVVPFRSRRRSVSK